MRTMYIILSWIGWGWLAIAGPFLVFALASKPRRVRGSDAAEAEVRP